MQQVAYAEFRFIFVLERKETRRQTRSPMFFGLFYKSTRFFFIMNVHKLKQTFYNSDYSHD